MIFFILELTMAPLHIIQGSIVTYKSQSVSLQPPNVSDASFIANISACAVLSLRVSVKLWPLPIISLSLTITAPIGVSPLSYAFLASFIASFIKNILSIFPPKHITY